MTLASIPMTTASIPMTLDALDALRRATGVEKVLPYDHRIVPQETGYWCGPSSAQVVLNSRGIVVEERVLAREIGTDEGGTDFVELSERVLDRRVPQARYTSVDMPNDPPSPAQRERLWRDLVRSIDAGWGVIMNWVAPPWNYPRGVKGSISPAYHGGWVYHYVAAMATTTPRARGRCGSPTPASALRVLVRLRPGRDPHPAEGLHVRRRRPLTADQALDYIAAQLGLGDPSWPSLGTNERGEPLTLRDARHISRRFAELPDLKLIGFHGHTDLATCEIATFRYRVLHVAAGITRGARKVRLRIDATWRWATAICQAWQRLRAAFP